MVGKLYNGLRTLEIYQLNLQPVIESVENREYPAEEPCMRFTSGPVGVAIATGDNNGVILAHYLTQSGLGSPA